MSQKILVVGTFDSKKSEYEYLVSEINRLGFETLLMDVGTFSDGLRNDCESVSSGEVLQAAGENVESIRQSNDRGHAMNAMTIGAAKFARELFEAGKINAVIGMGGSGGSSVISAAMRSLPLGVPKVLLSTMVGENSSEYVGSKDVVLIPSITDISGLNRISRKMIASAAAAVTGMAAAYQPVTDQAVKSKRVIAVSMFGNTTDCVNRCRDQLEHGDNEVIVFHATGVGGRTMESLIDDGLIDACLDITTTEIADEICGGILSAGPNRLLAAGRKGTPHMVVPGCVDMVNFGSTASIPGKYRSSDRNFYEWNPSVTLMRTSVEENVQIGKFIASRLNQAKGKVEVLLPLKGVSILDGDGERFCDREADQALFDTLTSELSTEIRVTEIDCNINDPQFADKAVEIFGTMLEAPVSN